MLKDANAAGRAGSRGISRRCTVIFKTRRGPGYTGHRQETYRFACAGSNATGRGHIAGVVISGVEERARGDPVKRWDDWRTFLAVARTGTVAGAATELEVNLTTVYRRLDALEEDLGTRLFDRDGKGYALTAVGRDAVEHAERMAEEMMALERTVRGHDRQASGEVVVTMPESLLPTLLPPLLAFGEVHPRIQLALELHDRMFDLGRREADVAIRPSLHPPEEAVGRRIASVAWTEYGVEGTASAAPWVGYTDQLGDLAAERWRRSQPGGPSTRLSVSSVPAMRRVLALGGRRGMLPCFVGDPAPELVRRRRPEEGMGSVLWLLIHAELRRNARVRAFVDFFYPRLEGLRSVFEGTAG